jgi:hypothetical protein
LLHFRSGLPATRLGRRGESVECGTYHDRVVASDSPALGPERKPRCAMTTAAASREQSRRRTPAAKDYRTPRSLRVQLQDRWAVFLSAATAALLIRPYIFFQNDDFYQFHIAQQDGLGAELLGLNVFQHFAPLNRLAHWLVFTVSPLDWRPAYGLVVVLLFSWAFAVHSLLSAIGATRGRRAILVIFATLSPAVLAATPFFDSAVHTVGLLACMAAFLCAHTYGVLENRRKWHVLSLLWLILGLMIQIRGVLVVPMAVLLDVLVTLRHIPVRERVKRLRPIMPAVAFAALIVTVWGLLVKTNYTMVEPDTPTNPEGIIIGILGEVITQFLPGSYIGWTPGKNEGPVAKVVFAAVLLGLAIWLVRRRSSNLGPIAFFLLSVVMLYEFLRWSILLKHGVYYNAGLAHYLALCVLPLVVMLASLQLDLRGRIEPRFRMIPALLVFLVLIPSCITYLATRSEVPRAARAYLDAIRDDRRWSRSDVTLIPLRAPSTFVYSWATWLGLHEHILRLVDRDWASGTIGGPPVLITDSGRTRDAALERVATAVLSPQEHCRQIGDGQKPARFVLSNPVYVQTGAMVIRYVAPAKTLATVTAVNEDDSIFAIAPEPVVLDKGSHSILVRVPHRAPTFHMVQITADKPNVTLCVDSIDVMRPYLAYSDQGRSMCARVSPTGTRGHSVPCASLDLVRLTGGEAPKIERQPGRLS